MSLPYGVCCVCGESICPWDADRICADCDQEEDYEYDMTEEKAANLISPDDPMGIKSASEWEKEQAKIIEENGWYLIDYDDE
jgi:hypothetical protein